MLQALVTGSAVLVLGLLSLQFTLKGAHLAAIWPANSVVVAALLRAETRRWPLLMATGAGALLAAILISRGIPWASVGLVLCNSLEIFVCAVGMRMALGSDIDLTRGRQMVLFVFVASLSALASAIPASWVLHLSRHRPAGQFFQEWYFATALGLLILVPALLAISRAALLRLVAADRVWRCVGLFGLLAVCLAAVFVQPQVQLLFLVMPVLMLITFQLDLVGGVLAVLVTAGATIALCLAGYGPASLISGSLIDRLLLIQLFLAVATLSVLVTAAIRGQQVRLTASLRVSLGETEVARAEALELHRWATLAEEIAGVGHWRREVGTRAGRWSDEVFRIFGRDPALGAPDAQTALAYYHPDDRDRVVAAYNTTRADGRPFKMEARIVRADGEVRHLLSRGAGEVGADGRIVAVFGVFVDVTEAKRAEQVLRESEERYRMLTDRATDVIVRYNTASVIEFVSPSVRQLGFEPQDMLGRPILDMVHPEDRDRVRKVSSDTLKGARYADDQSNDMRIRCANGDWLWMQGSPSAIRGDDGEVIGVVSVLRDVSARRALEAELRRKQAEAEAATVAKSEFLANMSHEIRTPLTAIIGFSGLLEALPGLPGDADRFIQRIANGGRSLLAVVNDILDFSKLEAGQVELDPHPFDPASLIDGAMALVAMQASSRGLHLSLVIEDQLPALVDADSARLTQVLLNLLTNAIKFTDRGVVTVTAAYQSTAGVLSVSVADSGQGIPSDKRDRLFERFSQVDSSVNRSHGGTGLGLAICKSLVELMGGAITVDSAEGVGSTFAFTIAAPLAQAPPTVKAAGSIVVQPGDTAPARVLVVDDVAGNRELARVLLETMGHSVAEAAGGGEAVKTARDHRFDLILMDLQMPGMDGLTAARLIRETVGPNRQTPIVALTANVLAEQIAQCQAAGMNDHIAKPINVEELVTKVALWTCPQEGGAAETVSA